MYLEVSQIVDGGWDGLQEVAAQVELLQANVVHVRQVVQLGALQIQHLGTSQVKSILFRYPVGA
jgi:hypothetical protein